MTASHGRASRSRRAWLSAALVASGLILASGARPARACHIHHDTKSAQAGSSTGMSPTESFQQALQNFLTAWHDKTMPPAPVAVPTSGMTYAAAEYLVPPAQAAPTVRNWHQTQTAGCAPPTPPPPCPSGTSTAVVTPPTPLSAPSAFQNAPTPAPEPSTILSALSLVGAVAWRRRRRS